MSKFKKTSPCWCLFSSSSSSSSFYWLLSRRQAERWCRTLYQNVKLSTPSRELSELRIGQCHSTFCVSLYVWLFHNCSLHAWVIFLLNLIHLRAIDNPARDEEVEQEKEKEISDSYWTDGQAGEKPSISQPGKGMWILGKALLLTWRLNKRPRREFLHLFFSMTSQPCLVMSPSNPRSLPSIPASYLPTFTTVQQAFLSHLHYLLNSYISPLTNIEWAISVICENLCFFRRNVCKQYQVKQIKSLWWNI